ncbi:MAG: hypothetical protein K5901_07105 [Bacteroidales bacterium]|nr:hypothetical protein [Bacteroidales bacterium]
MKKFSIGIMVIAFALVAAGCRRESKYSEVPHIEFVSLEKVDNGTGHDSQAELTVYFQDGDGDIGLDESDKNPVFAVDSPYYYNFFIDFYEKQQGEWVKIDLPTPLHSRVPHLSDNVPESIEGKLTIVTYINNPFSPYDTVRLTCWLVDRALHHSDTITTPEIIVKK